MQMPLSNVVAVPGYVAPPENLRARLNGAPLSIEDYFSFGRWGAEAISETLERQGVLLDDLGHILDFGCGSARTIQPIARMTGASLTGCDIDADAIGWCADAIGNVRFDLTEPHPPLPYSDGEFDLAYALSVFSHLPEAMQASWLLEMARVVRPGGWLYLTFSGRPIYDEYAESYPLGTKEWLEGYGFIFVKNISCGEFPDWYQTSLQTVDYLRRKLPPQWEIVEHRERGHVGWQDSLLLRRR